MSEYQYYEWQTIDRPLTSAQQAEVDQLSSHIYVTSTRAQVDYSWGDFKHDPLDVLADYFDAYLYMANWGSLNLAFRFPQNLLNVAEIEPYLDEDHVTLEQRKGYYILAFDMEDESSYADWIEPEGMLGALASLRNDILRGDYRVLYLAWLRATELRSGYYYEDEYGDEIEDEDETEEPPIPAGLNRLTAALKAFVEWSELDPILLEAAVKSAPPAQSDAEINWGAAIAKLSRSECEDFLRRLVADEAHLSLSLRRHLAQKTGDSPKSKTPPRRTVAELIEAQQMLEEAEAQRQAEEKRRRIEARLAGLMENEEAIWSEVANLLNRSYQPNDYDTAAKQLAELHQLAEHRQALPAFRQRLDQLLLPFRRRSSLMSRLKQKGLL